MMRMFIYFFIGIFAAGCSFSPVSQDDNMQESLKRTDQKEIVKNIEPEKLQKRVVSSSRLNPFITPEEAERFNREYRQVIEDMKLSAIFHSPPNSYAVVDGYVVKESSFLGNKQIVSIDIEKVILKDAQQEYIIYLN